MIVFDDGTGPALYIGGQFTSAGGVAATNIARFDGQTWSAVGGGVNGTVFAMAVYDDGLGGGPALYVSGSFTQAGGSPATRVARWNGQAWSALGAGMNGSAVTAMCVFDDGGGPDLYFGGNFTMAGGVSCYKIARWDGTVFSPLGLGIGPPPPQAPIVYALAVYDDGTGPALYAGGAFPSAENGAVPASNIAKWNGTAWSGVQEGVNGQVNTLLVHNDGSGVGPALYVGGDFTAADAVLAQRTARWNGTEWSGLGLGMDNGEVGALAVFDDGTGSGPALYATGTFTQAESLPASRVARWDGESWSGVGIGFDDGGGLALAGFNSGAPALYAGGSFTTSGGILTRRLSRWVCSPLGACCLPSGSCELRTEQTCVFDGGVYSGDGTDCSSIPPCTPAPTGACCLPTGCQVLWATGLGSCQAQNGLYFGDGTACDIGQCDGYLFEVEPNNSTSQANPLVVQPGAALVGVSIATSGEGDLDSADYFRLQTAAAPLGIYRHRLALRNSNPSTPNNSASLPGRTQTPVVGGQWPCFSGVSSGTEGGGQVHFQDGDDRVNYWYGFGKQELVYYRVSGVASTTSVYVASYESEPVAPIDLGTFRGPILTVDTSGQGHSNDTHVRVYDGTLTAIPGYSNDGATINGGAPANVNTTSFLRREYENGTYYMAITLVNLATSEGSPCDDNVRAGLMHEFPDAAVCTGAATATDVSFRVTDADGATAFPASRGGRGEVAWFRFTVSDTVCAADWNNDDAVNSSDISGFLTSWLASIQGGTLEADFNGDLVVNSGDISAFLTAWLDAVTNGC